jgi:sugar lactone lactonase YvrE
VKTRLVFFLFIFVLLAPSGRSQADLHRTSTIETIAGDETTTGKEFSLFSVSGLVADSQGNIYFSIQAKNLVFRLAVDGHVTIFAGNGTREKQIDGVIAADSPLPDPRSLAVDRAGDVYIVCGNGLVRVDGKTQVLSTVFETPLARPGSPVSIGEINEMVVGPDGNLYLSDGEDWRIKSYSFGSGAVAVIAGNGTLGPAKNGMPALSSPLKYPQSVAVGPEGTVYFSTLEPFIFRVAPQDGKLQIVNIAPPEQITQVGEYDIPRSITLDGKGHLFVAQPNKSRVLQIDLKSSAVSVYAGTGQQGFNGDAIPADRASLIGPDHVACAASGDLIIAENHRIRSIDSSTRLVSTRAGSGGPVVDDPRTLAFRVQLREPANSVVAPDGALYITSSFSNRLVRQDRNGGLVSAAGGGSFVRIGSEPGFAARVALYRPQGVWLENDQVFFSDDDNRIIRHFDPVSGFVTNVAVTPKNFNSSSLFLYYAGALVSAGKYFYLSDPNGNCVWRISRIDGTVELYVGKAPSVSGPASDSGSAQLAAPSGLALDTAGNLYIADGYIDSKKGRILRVDARSRSVTTILENLRQPSGLAFRSANTLCFSESGGNRVGCLNLKLHSVRVVAGTGAAGFSGDGGPAECAQLNRPSGISFDQQGNLYIADTGNQRIRRVHVGLHTEQCRKGIETVRRTPN